MKETIQLALVGLGCRGHELLENVILFHERVEIAAVCDAYEDRCRDVADIIEKSGRRRPLTTTQYGDILKMEEKLSPIYTFQR